MNGLLLAALALCPPAAPEPTLPPVCPEDVYRFPPEAWVQKRRADGDRFRDVLVARIRVGPRATWEGPALQASLQAEEAWYRVWAAKMGDGPSCNAVEHLRVLRDLIGPEAYARGELPPLIPPRAFTPTD